ncbi:MAG: nucleotidyltransferase family protein [Bacillota bacterium]
MKFGLKDDIIRKIIGELAKCAQVKRAVIFGSRARGDYRYNSDIDIAVYAEGGVPAELYLNLDEAAGIYKINLVDMGGLENEKLRLSIEGQGVEIYSRAG